MFPGSAAPGDEAAAGDLGEAVPADLGDFESLIVLVNSFFVRRGSAEKGKGSVTRVTRGKPRQEMYLKGCQEKHRMVPHHETRVPARLPLRWFRHACHVEVG